MGRIFTFDEIERGHVPDTQAFADIVAMLRLRLPHVRGFMGGVLCGSTIAENFTRRSDIDGIALYDPAHRDAMQGAMQAMHEEAAARHVPLDFRTIRSDMAKIGAHGLSASFASHLHDAAKLRNGLIGTEYLPEPIRLARKATAEKMLRETREYIARKLDRFGHAANRLPTLSEADLYRFLEKMISVPVHAARKILRLDGRALIHNDLKGTVIADYRGKISEKELRIFDRLVHTDEEYTMALPTHLENRNRTEYAIWIGAICNLIPDCMELLAIMLAKLSKR